MDPKRELSSIDIAAITRELDSIIDAKVDKAYLYGDSLVRLKLRHKDFGRLELIIEVGDVKRIHLADPANVSDAPDRPPNFAMMMRNRLTSATLTSVTQHEFDRIVRLEFERTDGRTEVIVELFGQGNVVVLDEFGDVVDSLETVRLQSRTVAPGSRFDYPDTRINPFSIEEGQFTRTFRDSGSDVVRTLATQINLGGVYAEELCFRCDIEKTQLIAQTTDNQISNLFSQLRAIGSVIYEGRFDPRIYRNEDGFIDVTPLPLERYSDLTAETFELFNDALDEYFTNLETQADAAGDGQPDFAAQTERKSRIIEQQRSAIDRFDSAAQSEREHAEMLYANYDIVDEILSTIRSAYRDGHSWEKIQTRIQEGVEKGIPEATMVRDIDESKAHVTIEIEGELIELDINDGVEKNADRIYTEAKRIEEKKAGALEAIERTRNELQDIEARRDAWESDDSTDLRESEEPLEIDWLSRPSIPVRQSDQWFHRFRWFTTSDGFLVIGGRNADQNEELVKKYLESGDRFFHAEAHGSPVAILKATGPSEPSRSVEFPDSTLNETAQFAISYSSVWKDGHFSGDVYSVSPSQVSKTPESGEYIEKGSFVIRGERTYFRDVPVGVGIGISCEPITEVIGGPTGPIVQQSETHIEIEPGRYAQADVAKRIYREFRGRFEDTSFVRKISSPDIIQKFLPPGGSRIIEQR